MKGISNGVVTEVAMNGHDKVIKSQGTTCADPNCFERSIFSPGNDWAFSTDGTKRYCPEHSKDAEPIPSPFALTETEQATLSAGSVDASQFVGISLAGQMQIGQGPHGFVVQMAAPMPVVLKAMKQSKLLGPTGQPVTENLPLGVPPAIRLVVPLASLTEEAVAEIEKTQAQPRRWKRA